ncbi:DUF1996 domain-containing protein [Paraburkholderia rhizosphaerae]|uniref:Uncharacterized protein DUF1996 n=1 Tax=Paraburkholderia rhizosphaerae TaxID=480658 RepID=A0A4R8LJV9_9BURK|nr:DUF1996 domain-containing protein [Paraburkholderia rhizosphaerae]TDY44425.1 uncharacterized protein DUF1996 [Paraburkholderia rhizosphaerae]
MRNNKFAVFACLICFGLQSYATSCLAGGQFAVNCTYSHTKPDDSIVWPNQPGQAMVHDFFGNTGTDAYSDYQTLSGNKLTTCDSKADVSAYWVPQLKRASGVIVPDFAKIYYKNDQPVVPLSPIPAGLQLLAGDHNGTGPKPQINYLCRGGGYTTTAPTNCPVVTDDSGTYAQLDISVHFPDCWNGKKIKPDTSGGDAHPAAAMRYSSMMDYMAYRNADGTCPSGFPVKIPELQLNVQYSLGQDPDLSTAQLSMDPMLVDGVLVPQWGSLYTAHGDFIDAWKIESMQYAIDKCSNADVACSNNIPLYYSPATADVWINGAGATTTTGPSLQVGPGDLILMKFPTPPHTGDYPWDVADLQTLGQNVTDANAVMLDLYGASTNWDDGSTPPTTANCTTQHIGGIYLDSTNQTRLNDVTSYVKNAIAAGEPTIAICMRNNTGTTAVFSSRDGAFSPALFLR